MAISSHAALSPRPIQVTLFGTHAESLRKTVDRFDKLTLVDESADVVVCYGGDGTLLAAERAYPGVPKVPVLNSRRGHRCIPHPAAEVLQGLAEDKLVANKYTKIRAEVLREGKRVLSGDLVALNEFNVHMGLINSAVRFQLWLNGDPYDSGVELLGDGFVVCTPFGSTAYFAQITRGIFTSGLGIAFKSTNAHIDHLIVPDDTEIRIRITRGPAVLAYDSADQYAQLMEDDELVVQKHHQAATILTCGPVRRLDEPF